MRTQLKGIFNRFKTVITVLAVFSFENVPSGAHALSCAETIRFELENSFAPGLDKKAFSQIIRKFQNTPSLVGLWAEAKAQLPSQNLPISPLDFIVSLLKNRQTYRTKLYSTETNPLDTAYDRFTDPQSGISVLIEHEEGRLLRFEKTPQIDLAILRRRQRIWEALQWNAQEIKTKIFSPNGSKIYADKTIVSNALSVLATAQAQTSPDLAALPRAELKRTAWDFLGEWISEHFEGGWSSARFNFDDGSTAFVGNTGHMLFIEIDGSLYRGNFSPPKTAENNVVPILNSKIADRLRRHLRPIQD